jgi:hypothetical protein
MCAAPLTWASPEERALHVGSAGALANAFLLHGVQWPSTVAEGMTFFFGAVSVFARIGLAPGDAVQSMHDLLADFEQAGGIPFAADTDLAYTLVALPAWRRMFPGYANPAGPAYSTAAPRKMAHGLSEEVRRVAKQLNEMGIGLHQLRTDLLELPARDAADEFVNQNVWDAVLTATARCALAAGPTATPPELGPIRAVRPGDEQVHVDNVAGVDVIPATFPAQRCAADIEHRVRAIYRSMAGDRYSTMTRRGGDYVKGLPPHDKRVRAPASLTPVALEARTRWLRDIYTLFVGKLLVLATNIAHLEMMDAYYVGDALSNRQNRAVELLARLSATWYARGEASTITSGLLAELLSPGVAYTHPVTAEELRYWIWCALEREYITSLATAQVPAGDEQARLDKKWSRMLAAALGPVALAPGEIAALMAHDKRTVSATWVDAVYTAWQALHVDDQLDLSAQTDTDRWVAQLRGALAEHGALGGEGAMPPSIHTTLDAIRDLVYTRLFLYTFHEQHEPRNADGMPLDLAAEIQRIVSVQYAAGMEHLAPDIARAAELRDFLERVWLPMTCTKSSPETLYAVRNRHVQLFIDHESEGVDDGSDVRIAALVPHGDNTYPLPARVAAIPVADVVRHVVLATREHVTSFNWHARFFRSWASRNASALAARLAYVARMDAYELDAGAMSAALRGELVRQERPVTVERLVFSTAMTTPTEWPLYKEWTNMRVAWTVDVEFPSTKQRIRVLAHGFDQFARILPVQEISGSSIWESVKEVCDGEPEETVHVIVQCNVRAEFVIARPATATEQVSAARTCIFTVLGKRASVAEPPRA